MRLDHLLSKERSKGCVSVECSYERKKTLINLSGGDACGGNTRSHPEHDGEDPCGRWYYAGDGMGEQAAARHFFEKALSSGREFYMLACKNGRTFDRQTKRTKKLRDTNGAERFVSFV